MIREYVPNDLEDMIRIWNEVVEEGVAFPQEEALDLESGAAFFASQSYTGVAEIDGRVLGLYILHPNNIGRCGHISNASFAVSSGARSPHRRAAGAGLPEEGQRAGLSGPAVQRRRGEQCPRAASL